MDRNSIASKLRPGDLVTDPNGKVVRVTEVSATKINYMGRLVFGTLVKGTNENGSNENGSDKYRRVAATGEVWTKE